MRVKLGLKLELFGGGWLSKMGLCQLFVIFLYILMLFFHGGFQLVNQHDEYLKLRVQIKEKPGSPHEMAATLAKPQPQMHTSVHGKNVFPC